MKILPHQHHTSHNLKHLLKAFFNEHQLICVHAVRRHANAFCGVNSAIPTFQRILAFKYDFSPAVEDF